MKRNWPALWSAVCVLALLLGILPLPAAAAGGGIVKQAGHLESAYLEWEPVAGATGYKVYIKAAGADDSGYQRLDDALVRQYPDHWRSDALGLAAGRYVMKVVPVQDDQDLPALVSDPLEVLAHDRSGYAFHGGSVPGAYAADGTLKAGAQVVYVTDENKNTVKLGKYTGFQNIISHVGDIGTPVAVRLIGKITGVSSNLVSVKTSNASLTIEGVGNDATAYGWGFSVSGASLFELRNLAIMKVAGGDHDGVTVQSSSYIWVHNCDFFYNERQDDPEGDKEKGDGSLDTKHSHYATYSYNRYWDTGKCNLQGSNTSDTSDYITYHHNWFDHSDSRHPRVRVAHVHVYNNYYDNNDDYGVAATTGAKVFVENNYFDGCSRPMLISMQGSETTGGLSKEDGGIIKAYGNIILNGTHVPYSQNSVDFDYFDAATRDQQVPSSVTTKKGGRTYDNFDTAADFYTYILHDADDVPAQVAAYAGRVEGGTFHYDMSTLTKGSKYPDAGLLAAMDSYACDLVSVGGGAGEAGVHNHKWSDWSVVKEPTCTEAGLKRRTCSASGCDSPTETEVLPALGHDYVDNVCTRCGDKLIGKVYTLNGGDVFTQMEAGNKPSGFKQGANSNYPDSFYVSSAGKYKYGTEDFFTLCYTAGTRVDPVPIDFPGCAGSHRVNFNGAVGVGKNSVQFTLESPATVTVWWTGGVAAGEDKTLRPMTILNASGKNAVTPTETIDNSTTPMVSTFSLTEPGTYDLGGQGGKNFIYQVTVTVEGEALPGTLGDNEELGWELSAAGELSIVDGQIPAGHSVIAACRDAEGRFLGAEVLTAEKAAALLVDGFESVTLFWVDDVQAPQCRSVIIEGGSGK